MPHARVEENTHNTSKYTIECLSFFAFNNDDDDDEPPCLGCPWKMFSFSPSSSSTSSELVASICGKDDEVGNDDNDDDGDSVCCPFLIFV